MGSWKTEVGSRKSEVRSQKWEVGSGKWEVGSKKWEVGGQKSNHAALSLNGQKSEIRSSERILNVPKRRQGVQRHGCSKK